MRVGFVVVLLIVRLECEKDCSRFKHGQSWKEDCQTCSCFEGTILCTGELCIPAFDYELTCNNTNNNLCSTTTCEHGGVTYRNGQYIRMDCKRCLCYEGNFKNSCQRDAQCEDEETLLCSDQGSEYRDGAVWMSKCHLCTCRSGQKFCTFSPEQCSLSCNMQRNKIRNQQYFRWGCQRCLCNNGLVMCTANPKERRLC
ncbi:hypothetical protein ACHWQZ_G006746 [Mnemiopsis leidyi]